MSAALVTIDDAEQKLRAAGCSYEQTIPLREARAAVAELIAALENSDAWIREMRIQHGLQATATLDQNRAALARVGGGK